MPDIDEQSFADVGGDLGLGVGAGELAPVVDEDVGLQLQLHRDVQHPQLPNPGKC